MKVTDKCCKKKEHCVLCHEGFGQSVPPETIVHIIEDTFLFSTKVIELDNFSYGRIIVVSQDTTVCVFSFPKILHTIHPFLSLNHKSICLTFPLLNKDRVQFKLNAIDFLSFPAFECKGVIVDRTAAISTDIEGLAVSFYFLHDFLGTRSTNSPEAIDNEPILFKSLKEPLQRVLLMETNICVTIAILYTDYQIANNSTPGR